MDSRERIQLALNHREADHVPFDLGGTPVSLIHITAYTNLRAYLGLPSVEPRLSLVVEQLAAIDEDLADRLETDVRLVMPQLPAGFEYIFTKDGRYERFTDEWGITWCKPVEGGFYYDMCGHPLATAESLHDFRVFQFPDPLDEQRFASLREEADRAVEKGKAVAVSSPCSGILEMYAWLRGYEQFYLDLAVNHEMVAYMLDRLVEFKLAYWQRAFEEVGNLADVAIEADDMAGQHTLLFSPDLYRKLIKPRHRRLFSGIKEMASVKLFFHSCGAVRPLIGDLMEVGVDILNPVQMSATGMNLQELKREFGDELVFWGGGVDTQQVLGTASSEEVRRHVKRNIETLAPGGGFVFAAVHDIQANVPPANIMAMWEAWKKVGSYRAD